MAWFRRKASEEDSLDPQVLLRKAEAAQPAAEPAATLGSFAGSGFRMPVEDVFTITGRGTVVTGKVEAGTVTKGQKLRLTRVGGNSREVEVSGVEMFRKVVDTAQTGDNVGLLLRHLNRSDVAPGDVLSG